MVKRLRVERARFHDFSMRPATDETAETKIVGRFQRRASRPPRSPLPRPHPFEKNQSAENIEKKHGTGRKNVSRTGQNRL